jgi:hypothetical protein
MPELVENEQCPCCGQLADYVLLGCPYSRAGGGCCPECCECEQPVELLSDMEDEGRAYYWERF